MDTTDARQIIEGHIASKKTHKHYDKVVALAKKYKAFITNVADSEGNYPLNEYLRQFVRREDADLFEQRKNLTKHYTPSICSQIMKPFNKVVRSNRVIKMIDHADAGKVETITDTLSNFYGESESDGVTQFMNERFKTLTFTDPNAWILVSFKPFDSKKEKPQTFPHEYNSEAVIDFEIKNGQTHWVIIKEIYSYADKEDNIKTADRYLFFDKINAYEYKAIPKDIKESFIKEETTIWTEEKSKQKYAVYIYEHLSERVPLMRVGYVSDISTKGLTYVNPFHYEAMPLLEQFIKVSSELQLSITLHTFPKQVSYVQPCEQKGCNDGLLSDGKTECSVCEGTGKKLHTTAADVLEIPFPNKMYKENMVDVSNISAYVPFPGNVMEFLDKYADKLEKKIMRMVFNSESLVQTQFNTATEAEIDIDSVYDTLHPFGEKYSEMWMFFVKITVLYLSIEGATIWHKFPSDLKLKAMKQLLEELKSANDSNAPSYVRESINNDIMEIIYADDQTELSKIKIKNKHFPFPGKSDFEIQNIILNNLTTKFKQVLYANFDNIFDEIENDDNKFFEWTYAKQKERIKVEVKNIISEIDKVVDNVPVLDLKTA
ncbi:hypothetical protein [Winogradskyella forsetii]|uniref:hypothetical protein n=1 Tax=Winogradskyella forsetii TaxID=2686077 RepID=UPI0015BF4469|nr:hypothetical protein [Winogradskyella forsetii]